MPRASALPTPGLRYHREHQLLTQEALARQAGVARSVIANLEAGGEARLTTIRKLATALQVDSSDLLRQPPDQP